MEPIISIPLSDWQQLLKDIAAIKEQLSVRKLDGDYIDEKDAAKIFNYQPIILRRKVKAGEILIRFQNVNGRSYSYHKGDIKNALRMTTKVEQHSKKTETI